MKKRIKNLSSLFFRYAIGVGVIAWLFETNQLNFSALSAIDGATAVFALVLCLLQLFLSAWRVKILLAAHHVLISLPRCALYNSVGIFYSMVLPGGMSGDAVRAYYFWCCNHTSNCSKSALVGALVTDRLIGTLAMLFVGLLAATVSAKTLGVRAEYLVIIWVAFVLGVGFYIMVCGTHKYGWGVRDTSRFKPVVERIKRILAKLDLRDYPRRVLWLSVLSSIIIHTAAVLVIFLFAIRLGAGLGFGQVMAVAPIGLLVNAVPITPGGLGVGEKGFDLLFSLVNGKNGGNVFMLSRIFLFSPAILGATFALLRLIFRSRISIPVPSFPEVSSFEV